MSNTKTHKRSRRITGRKSQSKTDASISRSYSCRFYFILPPQLKKYCKLIINFAVENFARMSLDVNDTSCRLPMPRKPNLIFQTHTINIAVILVINQYLKIRKMVESRIEYASGFDCADAEYLCLYVTMFILAFYSYG